MESFVGHMEGRSISGRLVEGKRNNARNGMWVNGSPPYGYMYDKNTRKLVLMLQEAAIVRTIFDMYLYEDKSIAEIVRTLNERGERTAKGHKWNGSSIARMLQNPVYAGKIIYGKNREIKLPSKGRKNRSNDRDKVIVAQGTHDPIIRSDEFERVQDILNERRSLPKQRNKGKYALSSLMVCSFCGNTLSMEMNHGRPVVKKCKHILEDGISRCTENRGIQQQKFMPLLVERLKKHRERILSKDGMTDTEKQEQIHRQLSDLNESLQRTILAKERILETYYDGFISKEELSRRMNDIEMKIHQQEGEIQRLKESGNILEEQVQQVKTETWRDLDLDLMTELAEVDPIGCNRVLKKLIDRIVFKYTSDGVRFRIQYK
ncbi:recombinase family protein [Bacillus songklensis]|uniref:Recombinase family protein n=1 Tax=Bacillus songklensis TaxID=1069116 RepID=A0ABV8B8E7_9BACI